MSVMKELQSEITRLARKELKKELEPIKRVNAAQRGYIADLRRDVTELQKQVARLQKASGQVPVEEAEEKNFWISGKGIVSLRKKLGLTQAQLAMLAGVSTQSVVKWEKVDGKIPFRSQETADAVQTVRAMGKRDAWEKLGKGT
jgi:DNA-binding transcriptional regulator YiaG